MKLKFEHIRTNGGTQPRERLRTEVIDDYADRMRDGIDLPPIVAFYDGSDYWLADGFHRLQASVMVDPNRPLEVDVRQGTLEDARWYSYSVNKTHGLRRTNEDKGRAVRGALMHPNSKDLSDAAIADHVGVSRDTVIKYRHELEPDLSVSYKSTARKGRDGRTINTSKIGRTTPRKVPKPRSAAEFAAAKLAGHNVRFSSEVSLRLPNNNIFNCAYDLLQRFTFEYLQQVFEQIVVLHQERLQQEASQ